MKCVAKEASDGSEERMKRGSKEASEGSEERLKRGAKEASEGAEERSEERRIRGERVARIQRPNEARGVESERRI